MTNIAVPEWLTSNAGVIDTVPPPWTPVKVTGDCLSCWGRECDFGNQPYPRAITVLGENLLAGPIELSADVDGRPVKWSKAKTSPVERHPNGRFAKRSAVCLSEYLLVETLVTLHYDGAMRLDTRVVPLKPVTINNLTLTIRQKRRHASLVWALRDGLASEEDRVFSPDRIPPDGWVSTFDPPAVWMGTEERGLTWYCESDEGWDQGEGAKRLTADRRQVTLGLGVIRTPRLLDTPFNFSIFLQANPWRPTEKGAEHFRNYHHHSLYKLTEDDLRSLHAKGYRTMIFHELWTQWHGYPETAHAKELFALVRRCHKIGLKLLVYLSPEFPRDCPEWPQWGERWTIIKNTPGHRNSPHVCYRTEWTEFILDRAERLLKKYDLDGFYLDAWNYWSKSCDDPLHGCGHTRPDGTRGRTYPVWKCRELTERLYAIVKGYKPDGRISVHSNPGLCIAQFATDCFAGEGYGGDFSKVNLPLIRAVHMGHEQWGVFSEFIASADYHYGESVGLIHNVLPRAGAYELSHQNVEDEPAAVWRIQDAFGKTRADWHPYYRTKRYVRAAPETVKVSLWNHPGRGALLAMANLGTEPAEAKIRIRWSELGYDEPLEALDMMPCEEAAVIRGQTVVATIPAGRNRLVFVSPKGARLRARMEKAKTWVDNLFRQRRAATKTDRWLLAGPFGDAPPELYPEGRGNPEVPPGYRGLETVYPPETQAFDARADFNLADGTRGAWREGRAHNGDFKMRPRAMPEAWSIAYLYTRICFPTLTPLLPDNPLDLHLWMPNAFKVWVNGNEVFSYGGKNHPRYGQCRMEANEHVINMVLHPGWNELMIKVVTRMHARFKYAITAPGGGKFPPMPVEALD